MTYDSLRNRRGTQPVLLVATVVSVFLSISMPVWGADSADAPATSTARLEILPPTLTTSPDYPAHFIIIRKMEDGTQRQLTVEDGIEIDVDDSAIASVADAGSLIANGEGETRLRVRWQGLEAYAVVRCESAVAAVPDFRHDISSILSKSGCNAGTCHGNLHGKGGFRLSLRGDDPAFDRASITRLQGGRRINWIEPQSSLLLRKPSGALAHRGGLKLPADSAGYSMMLRWIESGAPAVVDRPAAEDAAPRSAPRVRRLEVFPARAWLAPADRRHRIVVQAELDDGRRRDVTPWTRFESSVVSGVRISADGWVDADRPVDVGISVSYLDQKAQSRMVFLDRPSDGATIDRAGALRPIDRLVNDRLDRMRIDVLPSVNDERFLRRLFLAVTGRLPTADEVRQYLAAPEATRRSHWIDRALFDPGYADLWALHWSDLLRNEQKVMSPEGARRWNRWIRDSFAADVPLDTFVRQSISTVGSTYDTPAASFHRTHREPETAAEALGQVFLGIRIQCARCHNHPFDQWKQDDYYGLAAYFTTIDRKAIDNKPRDDLDSHVITGDEIISLSDRPPRIRHPGLSRDVSPKPIDKTGWDDSSSAVLDAPLDALADWLVVDNRRMARNLANRVWYHVMGRGIVDPPDDFRASNPPSNPELLEYLTDRLIESDFSTRTLLREILHSDVFARASISQSAPSDQLDGAPVFAGFPLRRMSAEVLLDAISDATGVPSELRIPETKEPLRTRAVQLAGVPRDGFLRTFGKPDRLLSCECERSADASLSQSLQMLNGEEMRSKVSHRPNVIEQLRMDDGDDPRFIDDLYLTVLTRYPTDEERQTMVDYLAGAADRRAAAEDILWALINSQEFPWIR